MPVQPGQPGSDRMGRRICSDAVRYKLGLTWQTSNVPVQGPVSDSGGMWEG